MAYKLSVHYSKLWWATNVSDAKFHSSYLFLFSNEGALGWEKTNYFSKQKVRQFAAVYVYLDIID